MRVKLVVGLAGSTISLKPGDEAEFPRDEALRLIESGAAVPVVVSDIETTAGARAPERRTKRKAL
jgi:hypothetical protein